MKRKRVLILAAGLAWSLAASAAPAAADDIQYYSYDVHGRLVLVQHSGTAEPGRTSDYAYDDADNRTERERDVAALRAPQELQSEIEAQTESVSESMGDSLAQDLTASGEDE